MGVLLLVFFLGFWGGVTFERVGWFILFGGIIYGIAGLGGPFVFGPSGAATVGLRVRTELRPSL